MNVNGELTLLYIRLCGEPTKMRKGGNVLDVLGLEVIVSLLFLIFLC